MFFHGFWGAPSASKSIAPSRVRLTPRTAPAAPPPLPVTPPASPSSQAALVAENVEEWEVLGGEILHSGLRLPEVLGVKISALGTSVSAFGKILGCFLGINISAFG